MIIEVIIIKIMVFIKGIYTTIVYLFVDKYKMKAPTSLAIYRTRALERNH